MALGKMRMTSTEFWEMSLSEFLLAIEGFADFHTDGKSPPMTRADLADLMERYPD